MKVLITGATGYIGSAVAAAVAASGHAVHGLAHTDEVAEQVRRSGWTPVPGDLQDAARLEQLTDDADAVIHAANTGGPNAAAVDTTAARAFMRALRGSDRVFVYTSGAWVLGPGESDETSPPNPPTLVAWRAGLESDILAGAPMLRGVVMRPGLVYGRAGGIPGMLARGELPVIGDGSQRWPLVHADDLADLYVGALKAPAGTILHGVARSATMGELALAGAAARGTIPEVVSLEEARTRLGPFAGALALDQYVKSDRTRHAVGWRPRMPQPERLVLLHHDPCADSPLADSVSGM